MSSAIIHALDEFASMDFSEDRESGRFKIVLEGDLRYGNMVAFKIGGLYFSETEFREWLDSARNGKSAGDINAT